MTSFDLVASEYLREVREAVGLTQGALASEIGVTDNQVSKYERGINRITLGRLHMIAPALGISPAAFVAEVERRQREQAA